MHNTFDVTKVPLASFHLEHEALQWFHWYIKDHEEPQWTDFCQLFLQQFGHLAFDDFTGALIKICHTGTVREYSTKFEKLANHKERFSHAFYKSFFISGLKDAIRSEVKMFYPNIMMESLELDKLA